MDASQHLHHLDFILALSCLCSVCLAANFFSCLLIFVQEGEILAEADFNMSQLPQCPRGNKLSQSEAFYQPLSSSLCWIYLYQ